jgi:hypothetical protein
MIILVNKKTYTCVALIFALLLAALIKALLPGLSSTAINLPGAYPDVYHFVWNVWFLRESFASNLSYQTSLLFWPFSASLYLHTLTEGVLLPITLLAPKLEPWRVYTLACLGTLTLNYLCAFLLCREISKAPINAALIAAAFSLHPFWYAHLDGGHLNMLAFFPIPLYLYCGLRMPKDFSLGAFGSILIGGLCIGFLPFTNLYYFYFLVLLLAILCVPLLVMRQTHSVRYIVGSTILGLCLASLRLLQTAKAGLSGEFSANHDPLLNSLNLAHLTSPSSYQLLASFVGLTASFPDAPNSSETAGYLGAILTVALIVIASRRSHILEKLSLAFLALFVALALGPKIHVFSHTLIWNPVFAALSWMPLFPSVPARFFCMALLAAMITLSLFAKRRPRFAILICALICIEWWPRAIEWQVIERSPLLERLNTSSFIAIHDSTRSLERRMLNQVFHQKPITAAFLARRPRDAARQLRRNSAIAFLEGRAAPDAAQISSTDFRELKIDGVLVPRNESEIISRARMIPGATLADSDDYFLLYDVRK